MPTPVRNIVPPGNTFSPVGYYRLGQAYPRSARRQTYPHLLTRGPVPSIMAAMVATPVDPTVYDYRYWGEPTRKSRIPFLQAINNMDLGELATLLYEQGFTFASTAEEWQAHVDLVVGLQQPVLQTAMRPKGLLSALLWYDDQDHTVVYSPTGPATITRPNRILQEQGNGAAMRILDALEGIYASNRELFLTSATLTNISNRDNWFAEPAVPHTHITLLNTGSGSAGNVLTPAQPNNRLVQKINLSAPTHFSWFVQSWEQNVDPAKQPYLAQQTIMNPQVIVSQMEIDQHSDHLAWQWLAFNNADFTTIWFRLSKAPEVITSGTTDTTWTSSVLFPGGVIVKDTNGDFSAVQVGDLACFAGAVSGRITAVNNAAVPKEFRVELPYVPGASTTSYGNLPKNKLYTIVRGIGSFRVWAYGMTAPIPGSLPAWNSIDDPLTGGNETLGQLRLSILDALDDMLDNQGFSDADKPRAQVLVRADNTQGLTNATGATTTQSRELTLHFWDPNRSGDVWAYSPPTVIAGETIPGWNSGGVAIPPGPRIMTVADDFSGNLGTGTTNAGGNSGKTVALPSFPVGLKAGDYVVNEDDEIFSHITQLGVLQNSTAGAVSFTQGSTSVNSVASTTTSNNTRHTMISEAGDALDAYYSTTIPAGNIPERVWLEGFANNTSPTLYADVYAYNFNTTSWDQLTVSTTRIAAGTSDVIYAYDLLPNHTDGNEVRIRFVLSEVGTNRQLNIDEFHIESRTPATTAQLLHADVAGNSKNYTLYARAGLYVRGKVVRRDATAKTITDTSKNFVTLGVSVGDEVVSATYPYTLGRRVINVTAHTLTLGGNSSVMLAVGDSYELWGNYVQICNYEQPTDTSEQASVKEPHGDLFATDGTPYRDAAGRSIESPWLTSWYTWLGQHWSGWIQQFADTIKSQIGSDKQLRYMDVDNEVGFGLSSWTIFSMGNSAGVRPYLDGPLGLRLFGAAITTTDIYTDWFHDRLGPAVEAYLLAGLNLADDNASNTPFITDPFTTSIRTAKIEQAMVHISRWHIAELQYDNIYSLFADVFDDLYITDWWYNCRSWDIPSAEDVEPAGYFGYVTGSTQGAALYSGGSYNRDIDSHRIEYPRANDDRTQWPAAQIPIKNATRTSTGLNPSDYPIVTLECFGRADIFNADGTYLTSDKGTDRYFNGIYPGCPVVVNDVTTSSTFFAQFAAGTTSEIPRRSYFVEHVGHVSGGAFVRGPDNEGNITAIQYRDTYRGGSGSTTLTNLPVSDRRECSFVDTRYPHNCFVAGFIRIRSMFSAADYPLGNYYPTLLSLREYVHDQMHWYHALIFHAKLHNEKYPTWYNTTNGVSASELIAQEDVYNLAMHELDALLPANLRFLSINFENKDTVSRGYSEHFISGVGLPTNQRLFRVTLLPHRAGKDPTAVTVGPTIQHEGYVEFTTRSGQKVLVPGQLIGATPESDESTTPNPLPDFESDFNDVGYWVLASFSAIVPDNVVALASRFGAVAARTVRQRAQNYVSWYMRRHRRPEWQLPNPGQTCAFPDYHPYGRFGIGVAQTKGNDYPLTQPDATIRHLLADFYLTYKEPADYDDTAEAFVPPLKLKWVYGLGCIENSPPDWAPTPTHTVDLVVVDQTDRVVFDSTQAESYIARNWGSRLRVHEWISDGAVCRMTSHTKWPIDLTPPAADYGMHIAPTRPELDNRSVERMPKRLTSITVNSVELTNTAVEFVEGYNLDMVPEFDTAVRSLRYENTIDFSAAPGGGIGIYPGCEPTPLVIKTVNGIAPTAGGDFFLAASGCYWVRQPTRLSTTVPRRTVPTISETPYSIPEAELPDSLAGQSTAAAGWPSAEPYAHLQLGNDCEPCCSCDDYVQVADYIKYVRDKYVLLGISAEGVRDQYSANKERWELARDCFHRRPLRITLQPQACPMIDVALQYCNQTDDCLSDLELTAVIEAGSGEGTIVPGFTFIWGASYRAGRRTSKMERYKMKGDWPTYSAHWDSVQPYDHVWVRFRLAFADCGVDPAGGAIVVEVTLTGTLNGQPIMVVAAPPETGLIEAVAVEQEALECPPSDDSGAGGAGVAACLPE